MHNHSHNHSHSHGADRLMITRIIIASVCTVVMMFLPSCFPFSLAVYLFIGYDVIWKALRGIFHGEVFDENFLMTIATLGAFALAFYEGSGDYSESISVILLYQIGEYFQSYAIRKSHNSIARQMAMHPEYHYEETDDTTSSKEAFITRFARWYTPTVCVGAILFALISFDSSDYIYRALTFLVISCPCALVISIPLTFFAGIGGACRKGIFFTSCGQVEEYAKRDGRTAPILIARKCMAIVWQNIIFAIGIKVVCLVLGAFGITSMWLAVFADTGVMLLTVANAMRCLR